LSLGVGILVSMSARTTQDTLPFTSGADGDGWRLDRATREAGRRGLAEARAALAAAVKRAEDRARAAERPQAA
jgi:hypothetical protein